MKKLALLLLSLLALTLLFAGCGSSDKETASTAAKTTLKVAATPVPHAEILQVVKPLLEKEGIDLQIVEMNDYVRPNMAVAEKELDANFFQHTPYLEKFSAEHNLQLANVAGVHIEPMGVYSKKIKSLNDLTDGAQVAIPNDPTNGGRALALLEKAGVLKLKEGVGINATAKDIVDNPKNLKVTELEAPQLPRALDDVAIAVINTNYALEAKLVPTKDALFIEQKDSPYVNILVVRKGDENRPEIQKLVKALTSEEVKKFINDKFQGAVVPAF
ncbi:D-methionine-binding lipoprotein MetQ [Propionispora sp. 2/2-37]|uniref:MetQ/NlpA family ABC transporter substrate-binding protein n=1 Tax=Propionispora sp. 2/2-37 TaxID=1677858 RepID=UPI0006BB5822|nr:MetQ/NlpA family ABC transporter substrate-binding protein [Propionispora sp. 2/2-37]CUH96328.1 D-methionine-binding lipoprotein MetQ [Propionispora sp. 2/2-37]